jgi:TolA-binding protein
MGSNPIGSIHKYPRKEFEMDTSLYAYFITILAISGWVTVAMQMREKERQQDRKKHKEAMDYCDLRIGSMERKIEEMRTNIEDQFDYLDDQVFELKHHNRKNSQQTAGKK